jgi:hypothetical protein
MGFIESEFFTPVQYRGKEYQEVVLIGAVLQLPADNLKKSGYPILRPARLLKITVTSRKPNISQLRIESIQA